VRFADKEAFVLSSYSQAVLEKQVRRPESVLSQEAYNRKGRWVKFGDSAASKRINNSWSLNWSPRVKLWVATFSD
jgi:hypothetical protein